MEIKAGKNGEYIIKYSEGTLAIDPSEDKDYTITFYTTKNKSNSKNLVIDWPGEYEASNVLCSAIQVIENDIEYRIINIEVDGFKLAFFGNNPKLIPEKLLKQLSTVQILALPMNTSVKDMQVLVEEIEPDITLAPKDLDYKDEEGNDKFSKFFKVLGQENIEVVDSLKLKNKEELQTSSNFIAISV